ncbi:hypothetical protein ACNKET_004763, partial [Escherichia coli]
MTLPVFITVIADHDKPQPSGCLLDGMPAINAKRVYRIMRQNALLLERKTAVPPSKRAHTGKVAVKESN